MAPRGFNAVVWIFLLAALFALASGRFALLGWILFGLAVVWNFARQWRHARKENAYDAYVVYLLLDDNIREKQKQGFEEWIRATDAKDASVLSSRAGIAIAALAEHLWRGDPAQPGTSSVLGSHAMLWQRKKAFAGGNP